MNNPRFHEDTSKFRERTVDRFSARQNYPGCTVNFSHPPSSPDQEASSARVQESTAENLPGHLLGELI